MKNIDEIKAIISSDSDMAEKINAMPYNLHLEDLIDFLGFCESTTRKITQQPGFPFVRTGISSPCPGHCFWNGIFPTVTIEKKKQTKFDRLKYSVLS